MQIALLSQMYVQKQCAKSSWKSKEKKSSNSCFWANCASGEMSEVVWNQKCEQTGDDLSLKILQTWNQMVDFRVKLAVNAQNLASESHIQVEPEKTWTSLGFVVESVSSPLPPVSSAGTLEFWWCKFTGSAVVTHQLSDVEQRRHSDRRSASSSWILQKTTENVVRLHHSADKWMSTVNMKNLWVNRKVNVTFDLSGGKVELKDH